MNKNDAQFRRFNLASIKLMQLSFSLLLRAKYYLFSELDRRNRSVELKHRRHEQRSHGEHQTVDVARHRTERDRHYNCNIRIRIPRALDVLATFKIRSTLSVNLSRNKWRHRSGFIMAVSSTSSHVQQLLVASMVNVPFVLQAQHNACWLQFTEFVIHVNSISYLFIRNFSPHKIYNS